MWGHKQLDEIHKGLIDQKIVEIAGEVDGDMAMYVREALLRLTAKGSPTITVMITSNGGSVKCGLDIYDALYHYKGEKTGIVQGFAASMAAVIVQACQKRHIMRHASILIHHISNTNISLDSLRKPSRVAEILADMEKDQARLYQILSNRTGHNLRKISKTCAKNEKMTAEEALAFGLVDEII